MTLAQTYANYTDKWYTSPEWLAWVRKTIGVKFFDPCPANWDGAVSGLSRKWGRSTYLNHPGEHGSAPVWWAKSLEEIIAGNCRKFIWCAFSVEQLRQMEPSPFLLPGWLVMPKSRIPFIDAKTGLPGKQPSNWAVFWTNTKPATPPVDSVIVRTGR